jgi:iron(III) transport system ATP-binding protein
VHSDLGLLSISSATALRDGESLLISVRPEDIQLSDSPLGGTNVVEAVVELKVFLGEVMDLQIRVGDRRLRARAHPSLRVEPGGTVHARMDPAKCVSIRTAA